MWQKDQHLEFHSDKVNIRETGGGNQTQMLLERQGNMPKMHSWQWHFFDCCAKTWNYTNDHRAKLQQMAADASNEMKSTYNPTDKDIFPAQRGMFN